MRLSAEPSSGPRPSRRLSRKTTRRDPPPDLLADPSPGSSGLGAPRSSPPVQASTRDLTASQDSRLFNACFAGGPQAASSRIRAAASQLSTNAQRTAPHGKDAKVTLACLGHTLRPAQMGQRVAVIGDGWGQALEGGYEAIVTEADHYTYSVVALSGDSPWSETHVLKSYCVLLDGRPSASGGGGRQKKGSSVQATGPRCSSVSGALTPTPRGGPVTAAASQKRNAGGGGSKSSRKRQCPGGGTRGSQAVPQRDRDGAKRGRRGN